MKCEDILTNFRNIIARKGESKICIYILMSYEADEKRTKKRTCGVIWGKKGLA